MASFNFIRNTAIVTVAILVAASAMAQNRYSRFDDLPGVVKSYKPAYDPGYPAWAKMLYREEVNVLELDQAFADWDSRHPGEENAIARYYKIWRRAAEPYMTEDGKLQLPDIQEYNTQLFKVQREASRHLKSGGGGNSKWTFLGPKQTFWLNESGGEQSPPSCPWQVNMYAFDVAPSDNRIIYAGSETGFMNKSTDNGLTWTQLGADYPFGGGITAVAIHPENPDVVYAAAGNQVHKTTDGGLTWMPLLPAASQFYPDRLIIDYRQPDKLVSASSRGVHITVDGGLTWTKSWNNASYDVEIKPDDPNVIYALCRNASGNFEVAVSTDGGTSFSPDPNFPTGINENSGGLLAVSAANPNLVFAVMLSSSNTPYLYKGTYNGTGRAWNLVATGQTNNFQMNNGQGYFDLVLGVSPVDPNIILAGTTTLFVSRNGGASFNAVGGYFGDFAVHPDIQDVRMLPSGKTWVSTDGGMILTDDNFTLTSKYYARVNGLVGSDMWGFDQGWNEDIIVGGRYHNGNTAIADFYLDKALRMGGAESPTGWVLQGVSRHVAFNDLGSGWILPATAEGNPEGRFVFGKYPNMEEYGGRRSNILIHPNYYGVLYVGQGNSIWKSSDMGLSFDRLYTFPDMVMWMQISYSQPDILYADVVNRGLYKSEDGGYTWTQKTSLTRSPNGTSYWRGKLFFAISPFNGNRIYACLQNGTWTSDLGRVYKSEDGGNTWTNWSGTVSEYLKCMVVQPASGGQDLVYLFSNSTNGSPAHVWYRTETMSGWESFGNNYPAGMHVNLALPFFRDSKIRVAGNGSVWESPLQDTAYTPIITPWVERPHVNCMTDTLHLNDHSIIDHRGVTWSWNISPEPAWISDRNSRNPSLVLGSPGSYDVTLTVSKNGQAHSRTLPAMIVATTCPSIADCSNPGSVPKNKWRLLHVDSEERNYPGLGIMAFDNDPTTIWHTRWSVNPTGYPHEFQVDMGDRYSIQQFQYQTRTDGENGRIKQFELYIGDDYENYGSPVATGEWENTSGLQTVKLAKTKSGRYWKLLALSEVNGNMWASAAEFNVIGCNGDTSGSDPVAMDGQVHAWPVPTTGLVTLDVPEQQSYAYVILTPDGRQAGQGVIGTKAGNATVDLSGYEAGIYILRLTTDSGTIYSIKLAKK